jgi:hypothetical protein
MAKHFAKVLQGDTVIEHHISKEMASIMCIKPESF